MFERLGAVAALLMACTGCAWISPDDYQPPDPIWMAVFGPISPTWNEVRPSPQQQGANERARRFVLQFLADAPSEFADNLERQKLACRPWNGWTCIYTQAHAPSSCVIPQRVSVEVNFPSRLSRPLEEKDVDVAAMVLVDHGYKDPYCVGAM